MQAKQSKPDAQQLRRSPLFANAAPWHLEEIHEAMEPIAVKKGHVLFEHGSDDGYSYFVTSGEIVLTGADGYEKRTTFSDDTSLSPVSNLRPRLFTVRAAGRLSGFRIPDMLVETLGSRGEASDGMQVDVDNDDETALRDLEFKLSLRLFQDLKNDAFTLPTLPDLALRIRQAAESDDTNAASIARLIETDPAMAAKIVATANSALYGGVGTIGSCSGAVVRLGLTTTQQLVVSYALKDVFYSSLPGQKKRMQTLWEHSAHTAALSFVLASEVDGIDAEQALLAGLLHDVGAIAALTYLQKSPDIAKAADNIVMLIDHLKGELGSMVLRHWQFSPPTVAVARSAEDWLRRHNGAADLADLVIVAQVHQMLSAGQADQLPPIPDISAMQRVFGDQASPEKSMEVLNAAREQIHSMEQLLGS